VDSNHNGNWNNLLKTNQKYVYPRTLINFFKDELRIKKKTLIEEEKIEKLIEKKEFSTKFEKEKIE